MLTLATGIVLLSACSNGPAPSELEHPAVVAVAELWCDELVSNGWKSDSDEGHERLLELLHDEEAGGGWSLYDRGYGWKTVRDHSDRYMVCVRP